MFQNYLLQKKNSCFQMSKNHSNLSCSDRSESDWESILWCRQRSRSWRRRRRNWSWRFSCKTDNSVGRKIDCCRIVLAVCQLNTKCIKGHFNSFKININHFKINVSRLKFFKEKRNKILSISISNCWEHNLNKKHFEFLTFN